MKTPTTITRFMLLGGATLIVLLAGLWPRGGNAESPPTKKLPYVYTHWKHFTVEDGLPDDHIMSVKVDGDRVWVGTEGGLACINKRTGEIRKWTEKDGLPWRVITGIDVNPKTGEVWLGLFGGGLARLAGGRFDHWHQLNSGLVNDVVYAVTMENDNVWAATTAGASRYNTKTGEWTIYTEKNSPMEEIWNYGVCYADGKVYLAIWGSGVLEFDVATERWKEYIDPDKEMEIDLYRDDGIVHVISTGVSYVDKILWVSTYFGTCRYDGRHWRGFYKQEGGPPSDFTNNVKARSGNEAYFFTDQGLSVMADFPSDTWVVYTRDPKTGRGVAEVKRGHEILERVEMDFVLPNRFTINGDLDAKDIWIGTSKGLAWGIGDDYYAGLRERPLHPVYLANSEQAPAPKAQGTPKVRGAGAVAALKR
jgi:ligand-binding sensor domain-containing protein